MIALRKNLTVAIISHVKAIKTIKTAEDITYIFFTIPLIAGLVLYENTGRDKEVKIVTIYEYELKFLLLKKYIFKVRTLKRVY